MRYPVKAGIRRAAIRAALFRVWVVAVLGWEVNGPIELFVSSEVETPNGRAGRQRVSTALDTNGIFPQLVAS